MAVVEKQDQSLYLMHMRRFRLGTEYGSVIGYLKLLGERMRTLHWVLIDQTGVGGMFVEEARTQLKNRKGRRIGKARIIAGFSFRRPCFV